MLSFAILYWLYPRLFGRPLLKPEWVTTHFWIATTGIVLYTVSMWAGGLTEGLFWRAIDPASGQLRYPVWAYVVEKLAPFYWMRLAGGTLFLAGVILMAINFIISARVARAATPAAGDAVPARA